MLIFQSINHLKNLSMESSNRRTENVKIIRQCNRISVSESASTHDKCREPLRCDLFEPAPAGKIRQDLIEPFPPAVCRLLNSCVSI